MFTEGLDNSALRWVKEVHMYVCMYFLCYVCGICIIYVCMYFVVDGFLKFGPIY